jgi:hypothetical protein
MSRERGGAVHRTTPGEQQMVRRGAEYGVG